MMKKPSTPEQHQKKMAKIKAQVDKKVEAANIERGIILILTGNGKGKSSSAFGMLARSLGYGQRCVVVQFIKGAWECGEALFFEQHEQVDYHALGAGFTWETQDKSADKKAAEAAWEVAQSRIEDANNQLVILDEFTYMFSQELLDLNKVIEVLSKRPVHQNIIITGRNAPQGLVDLADTVSEIKDVKHAFRQGIKAQKGIEF